jgi:hypothetical protein
VELSLPKTQTKKTTVRENNRAHMAMVAAMPPIAHSYSNDHSTMRDSDCQRKKTKDVFFFQQLSAERSMTPSTIPNARAGVTPLSQPKFQKPSLNIGRQSLIACRFLHAGGASFQRGA